MARPYAYEVKLPDFLALNPEEIGGMLASFRAALRGPRLRLLSYVNIVDPAEFEAVRRGHLARQKTDFGRTYMEQEVRLLRSDLERSPAWSMRHYLLTWQPVAALGGALTETLPPEPLPGEYLEEARRLRPVERGHPYLKLVASYEFRPAVWDWDRPWASMIAGADGPMILCLDAVRVSEDKIRLVRQGLVNTRKQLVNDPDARRLTQIANDALESGDEFYELRLLVLFSDARPERLEQRAERFCQTYDATLGLTRLDGQQAMALDFFSAQANPAMGTAAHSFMLGSGLPVAFGGLGGLVNRVTTEGTYFGFKLGKDDQPLGPLHWKLWTEGNRAGHMGLLGMTGSGKTVALSALLARFRATLNVNICLVEPIGNAAKLARLLERDPGLHFHVLDWSNIQLNPLDWIAESLDVTAGMGEQENHVKANLEVMLNRALTNIEEGFMAKALKLVYAGLSPAALDDPRQTPRLELFCGILSAFREVERYGNEADRLAAEIAGKYVTGGMGRIFNQATNLPLNFDGAHLFDAAAVAGADTGNKNFQTILYYALFSHFIRVARRDKQAGRKQRRIIAIDEYYALSQNPFLKSRLDVMVRTLRNLYASLWVAEQTLSTFSEATDNSLIANIPFWLMFHQGQAEAERVPQQFGGRCPLAYAARLPSLRQGECVALLDEAYLLQMKLLPMEFQALVKG